MSVAENSRGSWVGVAISRTEIVAYDTRLKSSGGPAWRMPLESPAGDQPSWVSLTTALRTLAQLTRESNGHLAVALLPSIAEVRRVDVPPLSDDEVEAVLSRNASKYFVGAQGPQLVGVAARNKSDTAGVVAGAAPSWIFRLITAAARDAGWTLELIAPAEAAWTVAISKAWPSATNGSAQLLVHQADQTHALSVTNGALDNLRKFRSAVADTAVFIESASSSSRLLAAGESNVRKQWNSALGARALTLSLPTNVSADVAADPALMAAAYIVDVRTLLFRTEEMRVADRKHRNTLAYALFAAAVLLLGVSAGLQMVDVNRELASVQAARAALTPQLATTLLGRASVETVSGQLAMLATSERESPQWSAILADLTRNLPDEAYLTAFRGWSDSVRFDGLAQRASAVYPALASAKSFSGIKSAAAVRLEPQVDGSLLEKFTLVGKLRPAAPAAKAASDTTTALRAAEKGAP